MGICCICICAPQRSLRCCAWGAQGSEYDAFTAVARGTEDVDFFETTSADVAKAAGLKARAPAFLLGTAHPGFEPQAVQAHKHPAFQTDQELEEQLAALLLAEKLPPFYEFTQGTQQKIFSSGVDKQVLPCALQAVLQALMHAY